MKRTPTSIYVDVEAVEVDTESESEDSSSDDDTAEDTEIVSEPSQTQMQLTQVSDISRDGKRMRDDSDLEELLRKVFREETKRIVDEQEARVIAAIAKLGAGIKQMICQK